MGYQVYRVGKRFGGYGVPTVCEYPTCKKKIDRGISHACGGEPFSELGCDRYFCSKHLYLVERDDELCTLCERCKKNKEPFDYKPETKKWIKHILTDDSWQEWREQNPDKVKEYQPNQPTK